MSKIKSSLEQLYTKHRILVWYDPEKSFSEELLELELPGIEIIEVENNEFAIKHKLLVEKPDQKFLLYLPYARPTNESNWLLDIELSQKLFHTNKESLLLADLELPIQFQSWIKKNSVFFASKERTNKFRKLATKTDDTQLLNLKLLQVILGAELYEVDYLLREYVKALKDNKAIDIYEKLEKFGLADIFWGEVKKQYEIDNKSHNIYDFLIELFKLGFRALFRNSLTVEIKDQVKTDRQASNAIVLLSKWKDLQSFLPTYIWLSTKIEEDLNIESLLNDATTEDLIDEDLFEAVDKHLIHDLIDKINNNTITVSQYEEIEKKRESKFWYTKYSIYYQALHKAILLIDTINHCPIEPIEELVDGFELYATTQFKVDQYYRQFIYLLRQAQASNILNPLYEKVEKLYSNKWLLNQANEWQRCIDKKEKWFFGGKSQLNFYQQYVKHNYVDKKRKVFVIISDALRYEIGQELHHTINNQNRFESKLDYMVTGLPSYTQLGMASLLPHNEISLGDSDDIFIDGLSTKGLLARAKILQQVGKIRATTISADELSSYKVRSEESRSLVQNHDVVYVYLNTIDKTGDDKISEERVFDAAAKEIENLVNLIRRISSINITHILVTADHGFIYQNKELHESDFADAQIEGALNKSNRRFAIGSGLTHNKLVAKFAAKDLKINSEAEVLITKSISRLRRQGSGSRFVHGGATLQEVVIPVLSIVKKKTDTIQKVDVDIINKGNNKITTNMQVVRFYQSEATSELYRGRNIKAYFAIRDGAQQNIISDPFLHNFDYAASRNEEREIVHHFTLSTNVQKSNEVYLVLEEEIEGSTTWQKYAEFRFSLTLGMMNDFADF